jgi:hypothetical protein
VKDKEFRFDPIEHRYWLGDEEIPGVTRIISPLNDFSKVPPGVLENKAKAGSDIHLTIKLWLDNNLVESTLDEGNKIALDLVNAWLISDDACQFGILKEWENPTYHEKLKYGGTADLVFDEAIVDLKTRKHNKYYDAVQLAGYLKMYPEWPPKSPWVLFIDIVNRKTTLQKAENRIAWSIFRKLLDKWRYDREMEETIKKWKGE